MCDPLTIAGLALSAGSAAANSAAESRVAHARTAALDAVKLGQRMAYEDAFAKGIVDRANVTKTWKGVLDDRERETHRQMEGVTVPFDAYYQTPDGLSEMEPGDQEWNCRCVSLVQAGAA